MIVLKGFRVFRASTFWRLGFNSKVSTSGSLRLKILDLIFQFSGLRSRAASGEGGGAAFGISWCRVSRFGVVLRSGK